MKYHFKNFEKAYNGKIGVWDARIKNKKRTVNNC